MLDEGFLRVGVNPHVDRLVADRAVSVEASIHGGQCATHLRAQAVRWSGAVCDLGTNQQSRSGEGPHHNPTGAS